MKCNCSCSIALCEISSTQCNILKLSWSKYDISNIVTTSLLKTNIYFGNLYRIGDTDTQDYWDTYLIYPWAEKHNFCWKILKKFVCNLGSCWEYSLKWHWMSKQRINRRSVLRADEDRWGAMVHQLTSYSSEFVLKQIFECQFLGLSLFPQTIFVRYLCKTLQFHNILINSSSLLWVVMFVWKTK